MLPIFAGAVILTGRKLLVRLPDQEVEVLAPAAFLRWLVTSCTGQRDLRALVLEGSRRWPRPQVQRMFRSLLAQGALVNADDWAMLTWSQAMRPWSLRQPPKEQEIQAHVQAAGAAAFSACAAPLAPRQSELLNLIRGRASCRSFAQQPVRRQALVDVLAASYGAVPRRQGMPVRRAVPAGGGLYTLTLYVAVRIGSKGLGEGVYRCNFDHEGRVGLELIGEDLQSLPLAFDDFKAVRTAAIALIYCANFRISGAKYGEKSLLYALLEAGHALQNAMLTAQALGLATVEVGGFSPNGLQRLLALPPGLAPLTTLAVGHAADEGVDVQLARIKTRWIEGSPRVRVGFHLVHASGPNGIDAWGRDREPQRAYDKALWECQERQACLAPVEGTLARRSDFDRALDPRQLIAFTDAQLARPDFRFRRFSPRSLYRWLPCLAADGSSAWCIAEAIVFLKALPAGYARRPLMNATSSGVAAGDDVLGARERALLELIERDAFMVRWMSGAVPAVWQGHPFTARVRALRACGVEVRLLDLTLDSVPVVGVWAQSRAGGYTAFGAAAHYDHEAAAQHALEQVEAQVSLLEDGVRANPIDVSKTSTAEHHASLYANKRFFRRADWFAEGARKAVRPRGPGHISSFLSLLDALAAQNREVYFYDFPTDATGSRVRVSRALVPGYIPLTFGFKTEPWAMTRVVESDGAAVSLVSKPRRPYFPHPFT